MRPGAHFLKGATERHVHARPHVNARSITVFDAVREAADAGMGAIGLIDINVNSAGFSEAEIRTMAATNPAALFRVGGPQSADDADD
jgi:hypothetical protein